MFTRDYTKYSEIFKPVYWGGFKAHCPEITEARNRFVERYDIVRAARTHEPRGLAYICAQLPAVDHVERYQTARGGNVVIVSPYGAAMDAHSGAAEIPDLWEECDKLYSLQACTFVFEYPDVAYLRKIIDDNIALWVASVPFEVSRQYPRQLKAIVRELRNVALDAYATRRIKAELLARISELRIPAACCCGLPV